jgi:hypothetical protein
MKDQPKKIEGSWFQCENCHGWFQTMRSKEETEAEYRENFGAESASDTERARICDKCYKRFMIWFKAQQQ